MYVCVCVCMCVCAIQGERGDNSPYLRYLILVPLKLALHTPNRLRHIVEQDPGCVVSGGALPECKCVYEQDIRYAKYRVGSAIGNPVPRVGRPDFDALGQLRFHCADFVGEFRAREVAPVQRLRAYRYRVQSTRVRGCDGNDGREVPLEGCFDVGPVVGGGGGG